MKDKLVHTFSSRITTEALPEAFNNPFRYTAHPLCRQAAGELKDYLATNPSLMESAKAGKMFGVLVVTDTDGLTGFLAAYSGLLEGKGTNSNYFVPPIYSVDEQNKLYQEADKDIMLLTREISDLEMSDSYLALLNEYETYKKSYTNGLVQWNEKLKLGKQQRDLLREQGVSEEEEARLVHESQYLKAEFKRYKICHTEKQKDFEDELNIYKQRIDDLKKHRKHLSVDLQKKIFERYVVSNAVGESRDILSIYQEYLRMHNSSFSQQKEEMPFPPSGTGDCAAPKLLQYAYMHKLKPLAMAEFWMGQSPKTELRREGHYYPACQRKCKLILWFMLKGLFNSRMHNEEQENLANRLELVYDDRYLCVVNKPAGMLSVPGKGEDISVYSEMKRRCPEASGPLIVHRLDQATSGLMVIAKNKDVHKSLQKQFAMHSIKKCYVAILEGIVAANEGVIYLPLRPDYDDRPRQIVCQDYGKQAVTRFQVIGRTEQHTRVLFMPLTGRTHQLRVHAAHHNGLNAPIVGDELYGQPAKRLYLHAQSIEFTHPVTMERLLFEKMAEF